MTVVDDSPVGDEDIAPLLEFEEDNAMTAAPPVESGVRGMGVVEADELAEAMVGEIRIGPGEIGCPATQLKVLQVGQRLECRRRVSRRQETGTG